jgi:hypothetical protein
VAHFRHHHRRKKTGGSVEKIRSHDGTVLTKIQDIVNEFSSHFGRVTEPPRNSTNLKYDLTEQEECFPKNNIRESFFLLWMREK